MTTRQDIELRFGNPQIIDKGPDAEFTNLAIYSAFVEFATVLDDLLPPGADKTITMYHLETTSMWAHTTAIRAKSKIKE